MSASSSALSPRGLMGSSRTLTSHDRDPATLLGFQFRDPSLFRQAMVHPSYCNEHGMDATESYERLEFLGDAVLELTISSYLYEKFPDADEGQLTKARASIVKGETLANVGRRWGIGEWLQVGRGVEDTRGRDQDSVLEAATEAVIAAVFLDQGMEAARKFITEKMVDELEALSAAMSAGNAPVENPKSRLQEILQGRGEPTPVYRAVDQVGPPHKPVFRVEVVAGEEILGVGSGGRKSDAEREAAEAALIALANGETNDDRTPI